MKKFVQTMLVCLVGISIAACGKQEVVIQSVNIDNKSTLKTDMYIGDTQTLTFSLEAVKGKDPYDLSIADAIAQNQITISSSDTSKLTISDLGLVTAIAKGSAVATIQAKADASIKDEVTFTIFDETIIVDAASIDNKDSVKPNLPVNAEKKLLITLTAHIGRNEATTVSSADALSAGLISISSSDNSVLTVNGENIKAVAPGTAVVSVKNKDGVTLDSLSVTVVDRVDGQSSLRLSDDDNQRARQGDSMTLPTVKAYDKDGHDVTSQVTITDSLGDSIAVSDTEFVSDKIGSHVLTYALEINGEIITEQITRNVYLRVLDEGGATDNITVIDEDKANPYVTTTNTGIGLRDFYVPLSKQYYAEWTWSSANGTSGGHIIAGAHFSDEVLNPEYAPFTYMGYKLNDGNTELAHGKTVNGWNVEGPRMWSSTSLIKAKDLDGLDPKTTAWKMAVARDGDAMYYFINDKLINVDYNPDFFNKDTKPGFMVKGNDQSAPDVTLSNFANETGLDAVTKINSLVNDSIFDYYTLYDNSKEANYATFAENGFTYIEKLATDNMDNMNSTMVAPYALLSGNFTLSFDFQGGLRGDNDGWGKIMFDLRTFQDKKTALMMSLVSGGDNNYYEGVIDSSEVGGQNKDVLSEITSVIGTMGAKEKYTITISLEVTASNVEKYTITILNTNNPSNVATVDYELTYTGEYQYLVGGPKLLVFHSQKWSGTVSNFQIAY